MNRIPLWKYMNQLQRTSWGTAMLGFFVNFTTTVSSGGVVTHRNWAALAFGAITVLLALISLPESLGDEEHRKEKLAAVGVAVILGALHIARGFGMFYSG